jgi:1-acyl-sn-glycerol-3-phosphate acyltransferase
MPWLHAFFPWVSRAAAFAYYRIEYAGTPVPRVGPALLVANHPNSLLDPMLVVAAAGRRVRFLAKAPLFTDPKTGFLVRAAGAIPVYRRADDPAQMERNVDAFRAVHEAIASGDAVGIFPEGLSHSEPSLASLKTGAARMALGAYAIAGRTFPIVPVGLVFRQKDVFRSRALVVRGEAVTWDDLARRGQEDGEAVRDLTDRIAEALRRVTVNLEDWADRPLVECAVRIWEAEHATPPAGVERVARLEVTTRILAEVRRRRDVEGEALACEVNAHRRRLDRLGLRPSDLGADVSVRRGLSWSVARVPFVMPLALVVALLGFLLFYVPYRLTGWVVDRARVDQDQRSTWKLLVGIAVYGIWVLAGAAVAGATRTTGTTGGGGAQGLLAGLAVLLLMPLIGMVGLVVRERWRGAWQDARRFFLLRSRRRLIAQLRANQQALGTRLDALYVRTGAQP